MICNIYCYHPSSSLAWRATWTLRVKKRGKAAFGSMIFPYWQYIIFYFIWKYLINFSFFIFWFWLVIHDNGVVKNKPITWEHTSNCLMPIIPVFFSYGTGGKYTSPIGCKAFDEGFVWEDIVSSTIQKTGFLIMAALLCCQFPAKHIKNGDWWYLNLKNGETQTPIMLTKTKCHISK